MSKAALAGLVKGLARDLGPRGITINNVQPGPIDTDLYPATSDFAETLRTVAPLGERVGWGTEVRPVDGCGHRSLRSRHR